VISLVRKKPYRTDALSGARRSLRTLQGLYRSLKGVKNHRVIILVVSNIVVISLIARRRHLDRFNSVNYSVIRRIKATTESRYLILRTCIYLLLRKQVIAAAIDF
jgi:hypothetical protein